jgi:hypothetical protein
VLFANQANSAAPSSEGAERTSSTKKLGLVKDQLEMVEVRGRDGTLRNEVRVDDCHVNVGQLSHSFYARDRRERKTRRRSDANSVFSRDA